MERIRTIVGEVKRSIDPTLLKAKMAYFFFLGSWGSILPIMSLWMRSRGLSKSQTGMLMSTRPFISFLALPIAGLIADRLKIHKALLLGLCTTASILRMMMVSGPSNWIVWIAIFFMMAEMFGTPVSSLLDAGVIELLGPARREHYGKQRVWGSFGYGLTALVMGAVIAAIVSNGSTKVGDSNSPISSPISPISPPISPISSPSISPIVGGPQIPSLPPVLPTPLAPETSPAVYNIYYWVHAVMVTVALIFFWFLPVNSVATPAPIWKSISIVFSNIHIFIFFLLITMVGAAQGVLGSYLFIMLDDMKASKLIMGLATAIACLAEMPFLFFSAPLLRVLGERNMLYMACIGGALRFSWYTWMRNPWLVLVAEVMHGPFFGALWTASMSYIHTIAPPGLGATAQGLLGGLYAGLGNGLGALVGGFIYQRFGYIVLFRACAVWLLFGLSLFFFTNMFFPQVPIPALAHVTSPESVQKRLEDQELQLDIEPSLSDLENGDWKGQTNEPADQPRPLSDDSHVISLENN